MIRRVSFIRRKAGLTRRNSSRIGPGATRRSCASFPACAGCVSAASIAACRRKPQWDGVGETWFDSIADADRAFATDPFRDMLIEDRAKFIGDAHSCYVEEPAGADAARSERAAQ